VSKKKVSRANRARRNLHFSNLPSLGPGWGRSRNTDHSFSRDKNYAEHSFITAPRDFPSALSLTTSSMDSQQHTCDGQVGAEGPTEHLQQSTLGAGIPNLKKSSRSDNCTWVGCQQTSLPDDSLRAHLECHSFDVMAGWTRGSKCMWQGCKSQAVFNTLARSRNI
jgi:hypothetical protein